MLFVNYAIHIVLCCVVLLSSRNKKGEFRCCFPRPGTGELQGDRGKKPEANHFQIFFYLESLTSSRLYARVNERCRREKGSLNLLLSENEDRNRRGHSVGFFLLLFVRLKKCLCLEYIEHIIVVAMVSLKNVT